MKHRKRHLLRGSALLLAIFATGCIENDIPFEIVPGNITTMEIRGAESLTLNSTDRTIALVLSDTVDLRHVFLNDIRITPDAKIVDNVTHQEMDTLDTYYLDLTQGGATYEIPAFDKEPYTFTVITYQDYVWTLKATQNIEQVFSLKNQQIGESKFSSTGNSVTAYVPMDVDLKTIQIKELQLGPSHATMDWVGPDGAIVENVDISTIHDFTLPQHFIVKFFDIIQEWTVIVEQSNQYVTDFSVNPWATFAYLSAQGLVSAGSPGFQIRKAGGGDDAWTAVADVKVDDVSFSGTAKGLTPATQYEVRGMVGSNFGEVTSFTTDAEVEVPNLSFDAWTLKSKTWFPNADAANSYWATGNAGVIIYASPNSIPVEGAGNTVDGTGKAARLETLGKVLIVQIAAGNLFTGTYETNIGDPATSAVMGRPYTGRPTRMTGWYKYTPQIVTTEGNSHSPNKHPDAVGKMDFCSIYIRLEDWGGATVRPATPTIIASAKLENDQVVSEYIPFDLKLTYNDLKAKPTHVVIVSSSSRYGDDFCGGPGSVLYVDQFALSFDYEE